MPKGKPRYIRCYDNEGNTVDRYTVVFTGRYTHKTNKQHWYLGMSYNPFSPMGVCVHGENNNQIDVPSYKHLGKKIQFSDMSKDAQECTIKLYLYLWDFTDENGNQINK
jgi:hypothetical protein